MPINAIGNSPQATAIAAYSQTEAASVRDGRTRQARPAADPVDSNPQQDQVTLSAQALQQTSGLSQINKSAETESSSEDQRERGREEVAAGSKSIAQALTAYHEASLV